MTDQDKKEIKQIFNDGIEQLVLPILDDIYKNIGDIRGDMATKKDLKRFATKEDLKPLATKADLVNLRDDVAALQTDVNRIELKHDKRDRDMDKRLSRVEAKLRFVK
jgi:hypothetical protein